MSNKVFYRKIQKYKIILFTSLISKVPLRSFKMKGESQHVNLKLIFYFLIMKHVMFVSVKVLIHPDGVVLKLSHSNWTLIQVASSVKEEVAMTQLQDINSDLCMR